MPTRNGKPDLAMLNGMGRSLNAAFALNSPVDPKLKKLIKQAEGVYTPDEASDDRVNQLLERLRGLPWDQPRT